MSERYDVVVVGGGHNGLTCAGYLAKAGKRVLVLETRDVVGGGCATKEVAAPGFRHNFHSNFHGIIHMGPVYRDLELERYGASYVWPENQFAHVFPDGRALVWSREPRRDGADASRASRRRDAETVRELVHSYMRVLERGDDSGDVLAAGAAVGGLRRARVDAGGLELARQFLTLAEPPRPQPLRVAGGPDLDRLLGRPARRHGRRLRARRQLPRDARRLDRALRLGRSASAAR